MDFNKFLEENKNKINILAEKNCKKNEDGKIVIEKTDAWYEENEWELEYEYMQKGELSCK